MLNNNDEINYKQDNTWDPTKAVHAEIGSQLYNRDDESESAAPASVKPEKLENIPKEMRERAQWCVAGEDKSPYIGNERKLYRAKVNEGPWLSFDKACELAIKHSANIGYILSKDDPYTCVDLDIKDANSKDKHGNPLPQTMWTTPSQLDWYRGIVLASNSYAELSTSGKGIHVWVEADLGEGRRGKGVEVYSQERFIICTGNSISDISYQNLFGVTVPNPKHGDPKPIAQRQALIESIVAEFGKEDVKIDLVEVEQKQPDEVIWERARTASNADKFIDLCKGDWKKWNFPSQSEADLALMSMFTFYTESNEQCRRMFRQTELGKREKAVKNDVYLNRTLKIIRGRQENEKKGTTDISVSLFKKQESAKLAVKSLGVFLSEQTVIEFIIDDVLKRGWLYSLTGYTGSGKTGIAVTIALNVATGSVLAGYETQGEPVLYIASENPDDVRNRFRASLSIGDWPISVNQKIHVIDQSFLLDQKLEDLEEIVINEKPCLVIVDTDQAISLSSKDSENDNGVRIEHAKRLRKLCSIGSRPTVLDLCHPSNATKDKPKPRGGSSFLSEVDGNIYCISKGNITTLCNDEDKFRGNPFQIEFLKGGVTHSDIVDSKGRKISTPVFSPVEAKLQESPKKQKDDKSLLLEVMKKYPQSTQSFWAKELSWINGKGEPDKSKVSKLLTKLSNENLVAKSGTKYNLTAKGNKFVRA